MAHFRFLLLIFAFASGFAETAGAASSREKPIKVACASLAQIEERINWCSDNKIAIKPAEDCYETLLDLWKSSAKDLASVLSDKNHQGFSSQNVEVGNALGDLNKTYAKLSELILVTDANADTISKYPTVMIQPMGFTNLPKCWTDVRGRLADVVKKLDDKIAEGRKAVAEVEHLAASTGVVLQHLDKHDSRAGLANKKIGVGDVFAGRSSNGVSDVTGSAKSAAKLGLMSVNGDADSRLAPTTRQGNASEPGVAIPMDSGITKGDATRMPDLDGAYSSRGSLSSAPAQGDGAGSSRSGSEQESSVGTVLWSEGSIAGSGLGLVNVSGADGVKGTAQNGSAGGNNNAGSPAAAPIRELASITASSLVVAGRDSDLFQLVRARYQASELFREARATFVSPGGSGP